MKFLEFDHTPLDAVRIAIRSVFIAIPLAIAITLAAWAIGTATGFAYLHADDAKSWALNKVWSGNWSPNGFCDYWANCRAYPSLAGDSHRGGDHRYYVNVWRYGTYRTCTADITVLGNDGSEYLPDKPWVPLWTCP